MTNIHITTNIIYCYLMCLRITMITKIIMKQKQKNKNLNYLKSNCGILISFIIP